MSLSSVLTGIGILSLSVAVVTLWHITRTQQRYLAAHDGHLQALNGLIALHGQSIDTLQRIEIRRIDKDRPMSTEGY